MNTSMLRNTADHLAAIDEIDRLLRHAGIGYWIFGGWAVDFHAGAITRSHADIDFAVWATDRARLDARLEDQSWTHTPEPGEDGYTCYLRAGVRVEVAFLARGEDGRVYTPLHEGRGDWPDDTFGDDVLELNGVGARVIARAGR
jgi:hypothetical protein